VNEFASVAKESVSILIESALTVEGLVSVVRELDSTMGALAVCKKCCDGVVLFQCTL
jgi:hypothetical protein